MSPRSAAVRRRVLAVAVAIAVLAWAARHAAEILSLRWLPGFSDQPGWVYLLLLPICLVVNIGQTVSPGLPRPLRRLAHVPIVLWCVVMVITLGAVVRSSDVPTGVLVLGLVGLPFLFGLTGVWPAAAPWLCCGSALLATFVDGARYTRVVMDALFAAAAGLTLLLAWCWALLAPPAQPPGSASADFDYDPRDERAPRHEDDDGPR